jgi:hypothetical protein
MSRISLVQLAGSVRKFNLNRPFISPILIRLSVLSLKIDDLYIAKLAMMVTRQLCLIVSYLANSDIAVSIFFNSVLARINSFSC